MRFPASIATLVVLLVVVSGVPAQTVRTAPLVTSGDPVRGPLDAPVTVVLFCDYTCSLCVSTSRAVSSVAEGRSDVRVVARDFPRERFAQAPLAAEAAACAQDQGRYWEMSERLFDNQGALDPLSLRGHARAVGLVGSTFDACLASRRHRAGWQADRQDGEALGVSGTPTLFVNGERVEGEVSAPELEALITQVGSRSGN